MKNKLLQQYKDADYNIRIKAPVMRIILIILISLSIPLNITLLLTGKYAEAGGIGIISLLSIFSLLILYRGRYLSAEHILIGGLITSVLLIMHGPHLIDDRIIGMTGLFGTSIIILSLLLSISRKALRIHFFTIFLNYLTLLPRLLFKQHQPVSELGRLYFPVLGTLIIIGVTVYQTRRVLDWVMKESLDRMKESHARARDLANLHDKAAEKLMMAQKMENLSQENAGSSLQIKDNTKTISSSIQDLAKRFEETRESLGKINRMMENLNTISEDQSANISETGAVMEEMIASVQSVNSVTEKRLQSAGQLEEAANWGIRDIQNTRQSFLEVEKNLDSVSNMSLLILDIADQINLLSINAAIEAAHAGNKGQGCAVVADEIRKLAETSSISARQIEETVKKLIDSVRTAGTEVEKSGSSFDKMRTEADLVQDAMKEINLSINEIAGGSDEVLKAVSSMNDLTYEVASLVKETNEQGESAGENLVQLEKFIQQLKNDMTNIESDSHSIYTVSTDLQEICNTINLFVKDFSATRESA